MKHKITATLLAALVMLLNIAVFSPAAQAAEDTAYFIEAPAYLSASASTEAIESNVALRDYLKEQLMKHNEKIDISSFRIPASQENAEAIIRLIQFQIPEAIHVDLTYGFYNLENSPYLYAIGPRYILTPEEFQTRLTECRQIAAELTADLADRSDAEKALLLHDRIALLCEYDHEAVVTLAPMAYNMAGVLLNGKAVCQGYAIAYQYLLALAGIDSYICHSPQMVHAWNIVTVNGEKYHVDVTWDDVTWGNSQREITGYVSHKNFLRSTAGIQATGHNGTDFDTSPAATTYDAASWQAVVTGFQLVGNDIFYLDQAAKAIKRYDDNAVMLDLSGESWKAASGGTYSGNFSYLAADGIYLLYSTPEAIYRFNPSTLKKEILYQPELKDGRLIYGFTLKNGYLICDLNDYPYPSENLMQVMAEYRATGMGDLVAILRYLIGSEQQVNIHFLDQNNDDLLSLTDAILLLKRLAA